MKKVLILGVSSPQYDAIQTLNDLGYITYAIAMSNDGPGARIAHYFAEINILDIERVVNYIIENKIDVVYSTGSDLAIPVSCEISERLKLPQFVSLETARITNNKDLMREALGKDFKGNIPYQIIKEKNTVIELPYPFIMKPTDSQGQRGVNVIHSYQEYEELFESTQSYSRSGHVILEYYVQGPEISVNGYVVDGELKYMTASDRVTWEQHLGLIHKHVVPTQTLNEEGYASLWDIMNRMLKKIGILNGPIYAQVKVEDSKPYVIEVTPRLDGCHMWKVLEKHENINLMKLTFQHLLEGNVSELEKISNDKLQYELEFICQEPNTKADYEGYKESISKSEDSFLYYSQDNLIRPVNNKFEKIGYMINKI